NSNSFVFNSLPITSSSFETIYSKILKPEIGFNSDLLFGVFLINSSLIEESLNQFAMDSFASFSFIDLVISKDAIFCKSTFLNGDNNSSIVSVPFGKYVL